MRLTAYGAKAAAMHLRYIERDGVEKDGSKGALYGPDGPVRRRTFEEPRFGEKHQFRLIVSPEDAGELDLTSYVRRLMGQIERDLGRKVEWAAVDHYDTGHPHAHIVVRGVDRDGQELRFDRSYIASGMRWRAQEIATQELGPRHEFEIRRARAREITQGRFTSLDRELERLSKDGRLELRSPKPRTRMDPSTLCSRLEHLEAMGLAERRVLQRVVLLRGLAEGAARPRDAQRHPQADSSKSCVGTRLAIESSVRARRCSPASTRARTSWSGGSQARGSPTRRGAPTTL